MKKVVINKIEDLELLRNINDDECYVSLENNLDFDNPKSYEDYARYKGKYRNGFEPIELRSASVIFNGNFFSIDNLTINLPQKDNVGFFNLDNESTMAFKNLNLRIANVVGRRNVGIIGGNFNGVINNTLVSGTSKGDMIVGGLIGNSNNYLILNSVYSTINIEGRGLKGLVCGNGKRVVLHSSNISPLDYIEEEHLGYTGYCDVLEMDERSNSKRKLQKSI